MMTTTVCTRCGGELSTGRRCIACASPVAHNTRIAALEAEKKRALDALAILGVPQGRARSVSNGIEVLSARFRKADMAQSVTIAALRAELDAARGAANRIEGDEVLARLRSGNATQEDQYNVANSLAYLWAQDGLLSEAQREVDQLRDQLAEVERPLDAQMARLNANMLAANRARMDAERELDALRAELEAAKRATDAALQIAREWQERAALAVRELDAARADAERWQDRAEKAERAYADMAKRGTWKEAANYSEYWRVRAEQAERALAAARKERT